MFLENNDAARAQGDVGEARAIYEFTKLGYQVSVPLAAHCPYDLIIDNGKKLQRVQVKTSNYLRKFVATESYEVCLSMTTTKQSNSAMSWHKKERNSEYDLLFVLTGDGNTWIIPEEDIPGGFTIALREGGKYEQYRSSV